ncbi:MAG TPA: hydroxymethylbilane synthase, partial [Solirubrobacteraceae bacterium]|nr:hydroxymethylbilane synthase [Solirubrobacteraceae bacterium]
MRVGTRGSALALAQARTVAALLGPEVELVTVTTSGDRASAANPSAAPASDVNDKQRWVKELELALMSGDVDLAVHSAKDVPSVLPHGLELAGAPARANPFDALVGATSLASLAPGARVGTASLRRAAQLLALREDLEIVVVRGNVDTRLRRFAEGQADALLLAAAGLQRLGRDAEIGCVLNDLVPAPGQGTLVLEARAGDERAKAAARAITDAVTWDALLAERACVAGLDASCNTPLGVHAQIDAECRAIVMRTFVGLPDGSSWLRDQTPPCESPAAAGALAAERLLAAGGAELLARAEEV